MAVYVLLQVLLRSLCESRRGGTERATQRGSYEKSAKLHLISPIDIGSAKAVRRRSFPQADSSRLSSRTLALGGAMRLILSLFVPIRAGQNLDVKLRAIGGIGNFCRLVSLLRANSRHILTEMGCWI
jgi:hypothetical protein